jgi:phosphatidate cytidylyltransferase
MGLTTLCCLLIGISWGVSPWWHFILLGLLLNIAAQCGDFFESVLKRSSGVKDSGHILPGHGGIMDRIDSLLFALPVYSLSREVVAFF